MLLPKGSTTAYVSTLVKANRISTTKGDRGIMQFMRMKLENFNLQEDRLDQFYSNLMGAKSEFQDLWRIVRLLLTLSHGIASVESGFSVNSDIMLQNMKKQSLVGQNCV